MGALEGKRALVTGGGQGIGRGIALRFGTEGAVVGVADISQVQADQTVAEIRVNGAGAEAMPVDVRDRRAARHMVERFAAATGGLDILVNSAGVIQIGSFLDVDDAAWDRVLDVNCKGLLWCSQAAAEVMIAQGHGGKIVNIASQAGRRGEPFTLPYCASKAAVISMTQSMALALAPHHITVNALAPGIIETPMWEDIDNQAVAALGRPAGEAKRIAVAGIPIARIGHPGDVAAAAVFLASADADYITQQCLNVDGGNWPS